jgi:hypothetical protein
MVASVAASRWHASSFKQIKRKSSEAATPLTMCCTHGELTSADEMNGSYVDWGRDCMNHAATHMHATTAVQIPHVHQAREASGGAWK